MRRLAAALLLCHAALAPSGQAQVRVVLLASGSHAAEWEAALRVELVASGGDVVLGAAPAAPTRVERDAEALVAARDAAAHAAVWVEPDARGELTVRVVDLVADTARSAPFLGAPDGRTIALLAVSLLEERVTAIRAAERSASATVSPTLVGRGSLATQLSGPVDTTRRGSSWRIVDSVPDGESPYQREVELREAERRAPAGSAYGMVGLGGFAFTQEGGSGTIFDPGSMLRLAIGAELGGVLRLGGILDGGFVRERFVNGGLELQPWIRACPEIGFVGDLGSVALHAGAHACGSAAELSSPLIGTEGNEWFGVGWSAGGFVAISFRTTRFLHVYIRGDLDGAMVSQWGRGADFIPVLSSMVSFE